MTFKVGDRVRRVQNPNHPVVVEGKYTVSFVSFDGFSIGLKEFPETGNIWSPEHFELVVETPKPTLTLETGDKVTMEFTVGKVFRDRSLYLIASDGAIYLVQEKAVLVGAKAVVQPVKPGDVVELLDNLPLTFKVDYVGAQRVFGSYVSGGEVGRESSFDLSRVRRVTT